MDIIELGGVVNTVGAFTFMVAPGDDGVAAVKESIKTYYDEMIETGSYDMDKEGREEWKSKYYPRADTLAKYLRAAFAQPIADSVEYQRVGVRSISEEGLINLEGTSAYNAFMSMLANKMLAPHWMLLNKTDVTDTRNKYLVLVYRHDNTTRQVEGIPANVETNFAVVVVVDMLEACKAAVKDYGCVPENGDMIVTFPAVVLTEEPYGYKLMHKVDAPDEFVATVLSYGEPEHNETVDSDKEG